MAPLWERPNDVFEARAIYDLGLGSNLRVGLLIKDGKWSLPAPNCNLSNKLREIFLIMQASPIQASELEDEIVWTGFENGSFALRPSTALNPVSWKDLIWFKGRIPKFSMCSWMVLQWPQDEGSLGPKRYPL